MRRFLATLGRAIIDGLATENGWMWAYGAGYPPSRYWPRADDLQPPGLRQPLDDRP